MQVLLRVHAMKGDREHCLEAGMDDYISKPIDVRQLDAVLDKWGNVSEGRAPSSGQA
jgi:CheY-like chemotaxis protein